MILDAPETSNSSLIVSPVVGDFGASTSGLQNVLPISSRDVRMRNLIVHHHSSPSEGERRERKRRMEKIPLQITPPEGWVPPGAGEDEHVETFLALEDALPPAYSSGDEWGGLPPLVHFSGEGWGEAMEDGATAFGDGRAPPAHHAAGPPYASSNASTPTASPPTATHAASLPAAETWEGEGEQAGHPPLFRMISGTPFCKWNGTHPPP